jgi:DNA transformation protein
VTRIRDLLNLGPVMESRLEAVGVTTAEQLARMGVVEAYRRLKAAHGPAITVSALYAMDAAIQGLDLKDLSPDRREELRLAAGAAA